LTFSLFGLVLSLRPEYAHTNESASYSPSLSSVRNRLLSSLAGPRFFFLLPICPPPQPPPSIGHPINGGVVCLLESTLSPQRFRLVSPLVRRYVYCPSAPLSLPSPPVALQRTRLLLHFLINFFSVSNLPSFAPRLPLRVHVRVFFAAISVLRIFPCHRSAIARVMQTATKFSCHPPPLIGLQFKPALFFFSRSAHSLLLFLSLPQRLLMIT